VRRAVIGPEVKDSVRRHAKEGDDAQQRHADLDLDRPLGPQTVVQPPADETAEHRQDAEDDAEEQHLQRVPAHHAGGVDAGIDEDRRHPVDVEHPGREEDRRVAVASHRPDHRPEVGGAASQGGQDRNARSWRVRREQENRQRPDSEDPRRHQGDHPLGLMERRCRPNSGALGTHDQVAVAGSREGRRPRR
jgi:hypothetical protein